LADDTAALTVIHGHRPGEPRRRRDGRTGIGRAVMPLVTDAVVSPATTFVAGEAAGQRT